MSHSPQTLENACLWAKELASLPAIRHVLVCKLDNYIVETFMGEVEQSVDFNECRHGNFDIYRRCGHCGTMVREDRMAETIAATRGEGREC